MSNYEEESLTRTHRISHTHTSHLINTTHPHTWREKEKEKQTTEWEWVKRERETGKVGFERNLRTRVRETAAEVWQEESVSVFVLCVHLVEHEEGDVECVLMTLLKSVCVWGHILLVPLSHGGTDTSLLSDKDLTVFSAVTVRMLFWLQII